MFNQSVASAEADLGLLQQPRWSALWYTKRSILDVAAVLDPPLNISYNIKRLNLKYLSAKKKRSENSYQDIYFLTKLLVIDPQVYFKIGSPCFFSPPKCSPLSIHGLCIASYCAWYFQLFSQSLIPFKMKLWHPLLEYGNIAMDRSILKFNIYDAPGFPRREYVDGLGNFVPFGQF